MVGFVLTFKEGMEEGTEEALVALLEGNVLLLLLPAPVEEEEVGGGVATGADDAAG